jgi:predicted CoA-substrate-specific enzyme activase
MFFVGIDIGSTAAKVAVRGSKELYFTLPTGWSSRETAITIKDKLLSEGIDVNSDDVKVAATGYGRTSVDYAHNTVTEISCHALGVISDISKNCTVIDVGGQDTKVISIRDGKVSDFIMNDKCASGTGKFVEIMANRLALTIDELFEIAKKGTVLPISSTCTVFAETEVINYIGIGKDRNDIAAGVADSVASKVALMYRDNLKSDEVVLTGGLSSIDYFREILSLKIGQDIINMPNGKYAGAIGAAQMAYKKSSPKS